MLAVQLRRLEQELVDEYERRGVPRHFAATAEPGKVTRAGIINGLLADRERAVKQSEYR